MFGKKKVEIPKVVQEDFTQWDKEMGFLFVKMARKKNIIKSYFIDVYNTQLDADMYIREDDVSDKISKGIFDVYTEISGRYKEHLVSKYFGSNEELIKFITEDFYVDLTSDVISKNKDKIQLLALKDRVKSVLEQNVEEEDNQ